MDQVILIDTSEATPQLPEKPSAGRRRKPAVKARSEPRENGVIKFLIVLLAISFFIPEQVHVLVGSLRITAMFGVSMLLFPMLLLFGRIRWVWPDLLILLLFGVYFVSTKRWAPWGETIETVGRLVLSGGAPYLVGRYVMQDIRRMGRFLALLVSVISVLAVVAVFESVNRFNIHCNLWGYAYDPHWEQRLGLTRAHGWTTHAIMFGLVNAIFLPVAAIAWKEKRNDLVGKWPLYKIGCMLLGVFLSLSTGAWMPAFVALALVAWDYYGPINRKMRWPITFSVVLGGYFLLEHASSRPLLRVLMMKLHISDPQAWWYRWRLYERVFGAMGDNWRLGWGETIPPEFQGLGWSIDNNYLVVLLKYGQVGLVLWCLVALSVFFYGGKAVWSVHESRTVRVARALSFSLLGVCLTQLSVALFSLAGVLYWLAIGLSIQAAYNCKREAAAAEKLRSASRRRAAVEARTRRGVQVAA